MALAGVAAMLGGLAYGYLTADLEAGFVDPGRDYFPVDMPSYPNAVQMPMGTDMRLNGAPHHMTYFVTQDPVQRVVDYYRGVWESQGYRVFGRWDERSGHVHVVEKDGTRKGISLLARGDDVLVLPSVIGGSGFELLAPADARFPALPGSQPVTRLEAYDAGRRNLTYVYQNAATLADNAVHIEEGMALEGFTLARSHAAPEGRPAVMGEYVRPGERCHLSVVARDDDDGDGREDGVVATFVLVEEE